jgi:hypothetical protein
MQYMLMHTGDQDMELSPEQAACDRALLGSWLEDVVPLGVDLHGERLRPTSDATTVKLRRGQLLVTDGPFAETKEQVGGYDVLECASLDEAVGWAAKHPTALLGAIEVRPLRNPPPPAPLAAPREGKTRYVMFVCLGEDFRVTPEQDTAMGPATDAWVRDADGSGARLFGSQLEGPEQARTVRRRQGQVLVTDGPFAETKEMIAGFDVLECSDLDEAIDLASRHPMAPFGMLELRPFWPFGEA